MHYNAIMLLVSESNQTNFIVLPYYNDNKVSILLTQNYKCIDDIVSQEADWQTNHLGETQQAKYMTDHKTCNDI